MRGGRRGVDLFWDEVVELTVAIESSCNFARLGSDVTQIEMLPRILLREDADVSALVQAALERDGVTAPALPVLQ